MRQSHLYLVGLAAAAALSGCSMTRPGVRPAPGALQAIGTVALSERLVYPRQTYFPGKGFDADAGGDTLTVVSGAWGSAGREIERERALRQGLDNYAIFATNLAAVFTREIDALPALRRVEWNLEAPADAEFLLQAWAFGFRDASLFGNDMKPWIKATGMLIDNPPYKLVPSWNPRVYWEVPDDQQRNAILWECTIYVEGTDEGVGVEPRPITEFLENADLLRDAAMRLSTRAGERLAEDLRVGAGGVE